MLFRSKRYNAPIGLGQAWVDETALRVKDTNYTNTSGRPIQLSVTFRTNSSATTMSLLVDGVIVVRESATAHHESLTANNIIPEGSTYNLTLTGGSAYFRNWAELR